MGRFNCCGRQQQVPTTYIHISTDSRSKSYVHIWMRKSLRHITSRVNPHYLLRSGSPGFFLFSTSGSYL